MGVISKIGLKTAKIAGKSGLGASQHAPEILTGVGIAGFVGTCVTVGKGTLKAQTILDNMREDHKVLDQAREYDKDYIEYSKKDEQIDRWTITVNGMKNLAKCYAPAACFGALTLSSFMGASYILRKRNIALIAAYGVLNDSFKRYRENVVNKYGEEEDYFLKNSVVSKKVEIEEEIDGKKKKKKVDIDVLEKDPTGYAFIFDDAHSMLTVNSSIVARDQLNMAEQSANTILKARGYITLNEILRGLGMEETTAGQIVGWTIKGEGDNYVDFNIRQIRTDGSEDGCAFLLDFNVDGPIYQHIDSFTKSWEA